MIYKYFFLGLCLIVFMTSAMVLEFCFLLGLVYIVYFFKLLHAFCVSVTDSARATQRECGR